MNALLFVAHTPIPLTRPHRPSVCGRRPPRMDVGEPLGESLVRTAMLGDLAALNALLASGAPASYASAQNDSGMTALMWAASEGDTNIVRALLARSADVNTKNRDGFSALIYAFEGLPNANPRPPPPPGFPNDPTRRGDVPQQLPAGARVTGHSDICELLIGEGAHVDVRNAYGETLVHLAARKARADWVGRLVGMGIPVDERSAGYRETALHLAAKEGHADVVRVLVRAGADIDARSRFGWTPLIWAAACANEDAVRALLESGADVNARTNDGDEGGDKGTTALAEARRCASPVVISKMLIRAGAI